jgi:hypothetical protein
MYRQQSLHFVKQWDSAMRRDGVAGGWRKLHNEEHDDSYSTSTTISFSFGCRGTESTITEATTGLDNDDDDDDEREAVGGMLGRGIQSTLRIPAPVPMCPPQIPY